jgi:hypothetical protein
MYEATAGLAKFDGDSSSDAFGDGDGGDVRAAGCPGGGAGGGRLPLRLRPADQVALGWQHSVCRTRLAGLLRLDDHA